MEQIPMIGEIDPNTIVDDAYYKCYPTEVHKHSDSPWFFTGRDVRAVLNRMEEYKMALMWGK